MKNAIAKAKKNHFFFASTKAMNKDSQFHTPDMI